MSTPHLEKRIILKNKEERRILRGHPWVFSNEVRETMGTPAIGDVVELVAASGRSLGIGFYNPHSLIAYRHLSSTIEELDSGFFTDRLQRALDLRKVLYTQEGSFRLVNGEADFLPGLVVDKYNDILVVQTYSFGMDTRLELICDALQSLVGCDTIIQRNESYLRVLEHLPQVKSVLRGTTTTTVVTEHGLQYAVDVLEGQKTGFFLDQRENRLAIKRFCPGKRVLDCFCNDGGFSLNAAAAGAVSVRGLDISVTAVERARKNAELNRLDAGFEEADVFEKLAQLQNEGALFDLIILDPPSFTKSRKNVPAAKKGYKDLHAAAFGIIEHGGILVSASCSHHIEPAVFLELIDDTARKCGRTIQLLEWRGAAPDHPTLPAVAETHYLKLGIFRIH